MYSPWVEASFAFAKGASLARIGREWGLSKLMNRILISAETMRKRQSYIKFGADKVDRRMSRKTERPDIWTYVTKNRGDEAPLAPTELHSNGTLFMLAGTETTATELSGLTYMLLRHPDKMARLTEEVRTAFKSTDEMTMAGLSRLPYLQACVEEALRLYPPVAVGLPRVAPKGGAEVCGRYVPGGVSQHIQGKKNLLILCRRLSKPPCSAPIDLQQISRTPTYSIPSETCSKMQLNTNLIGKTR
jgi:hypothetical protein